MRKWLISRYYPHMTLKQRLLFFILTLTVVTSFISIYSNINARKVVAKYNDMFQEIAYINELSNHVSQSQNLLRQYLITEDEEIKTQFVSLNAMIRHNLLRLSTSLNEEKSVLLYINIQSMFNNYIAESIEAYEKNEKNDSSYITNYIEANDISRYITNMLAQLMDNELIYNEKLYSTLKHRANIFQNSILVLLILLLFIGIVFTWGISNNIVQPIQKLVNQASKISQGELEMKDIEVESYDEIGHLTIAFNHMIHDIQKLIKEIKDNARLEGLLKEAELKALQAQVNPHFLFNTLSGITELALIEGADQTLNMVEEISKMLRYSLTSFHKKVTLEEELEMVKRYIYLQSQRFGDRIRFRIKIPDIIPTIIMPCMTIQPLVENAIIHGLEKKIEGGTIDLSVKQQKDKLIICIEDDGVGMTKDTVDHLFDEKSKKEHTGHTTGIGLNNVNERLHIFFGQAGLLNISSEINKGTCVTMLLPMTEN